MSRLISVHLDDATERRLLAASSELGRSIEDLAEAAVAEEALAFERSRGGHLRAAAFPLDGGESRFINRV